MQPHEMYDDDSDMGEPSFGLGAFCCTLNTQSGAPRSGDQGGGRGHTLLPKPTPGPASRTVAAGPPPCAESPGK